MTTTSIVRAILEQRNRKSAAVALTWSGFCEQQVFCSVSRIWVKENFDSTRLPYLLDSIYTNTIWQSCTKKIAEIFKRRPSKQAWTIHHELPLFVRHEFPQEVDNKPYPEFYMGSKLRWERIRSCMWKLPKYLDRNQKSKVMVQSRFYSLIETMAKLNVGLTMEWLT
jgi:hypothetical protein